MPIFVKHSVELDFFDCLKHKMPLGSRTPPGSNEEFMMLTNIGWVME